jgi:amino acid transporter
LAAQEFEAFGLGVMISLAMLVLEIAILAMYLSALRRKPSRQKLEPYLMILYLLICCSTAVGFLVFYGGKASNFKAATQALVVVCLIPNFAIIFILIHSLGFYKVRTQDGGYASPS